MPQRHNARASTVVWLVFGTTLFKLLDDLIRLLR